MKNIKIILLIILCLFSSKVYAESIDVTLSKCVDGDTAYFYIEGVSTKVRFLAIDTPESTTKVEEYGKEASEYTCTALTNAKSIKLEYDPKSDSTDKYGRTLAWVYVDDELLESKLVSEGLAEVAYIYDDYLYVDDLCSLEQTAYSKELNIWKSYSWDKTYCSSHVETKEVKEENNYIYYVYIIGILLVIILLFFIVKRVLL